MDTIVNIFVSLGVQKIVVVQFAIVVVLYFVLTKLFFSKLQFVLELRESKTTKREGQANSMFAKAESLSQEYKKALDDTQGAAFEKSSKQKAALLEKQREALKAKNREVDQKIEQERQANQKMIEEQRSVVMAKADELAKQLVEKLSK